MIPKIIHYCWLSGDPFPADIQRCIDSWQKYLPDYELRLWDTKRFDIESTQWTAQAFKAKKYAFAADYIRLYALYNYGGIYLDADVLVYKSFDDLLHLPYFIGCDQIGAFEAAVIGAEKGCPWIADILEHYTDRPFIKADGTMDMQELPITFHHELVQRGYTFRKVHNIEEFAHGSSRMSTDSLENSTLNTSHSSLLTPHSSLHTPHSTLLTSHSTLLHVFDGDFFNSRNQVEARQMPKSYCAHNYAGSWQKAAKKGWKARLPKWMLKIIFYISQKTWSRHKYDWFKIPFEK